VKRKRKQAFRQRKGSIQPAAPVDSAKELPTASLKSGNPTDPVGNVA
jgi:hypothetical protein